MSKNIDSISLSKRLLLTKILENDEYSKKFRYYDELLLKKRFSDVVEYSTTENLITMKTLNLTNSDINNIIDNFIKMHSSPRFFDKRYLYEVVKVSNLPGYRLSKALNQNTLENLCKALRDVSCETNLISFDFLVLHALDNFVVKLGEGMTRNSYKVLKKDIFKKFLTFQYQKEERERPVNYLCWIDRILVAATKYEINASEFILINSKILGLISKNPDVYWKMAQVVNFLCFQPGYSTSSSLRKLKRDVIKRIKDIYNLRSNNKDDIIELTIATLAKETVYKESYYYLFDMMNRYSSTEDNKLFVLEICYYLVYQHKKQNIFCFRFIRENFLNMLSLFNEKDSCAMEEKALLFFIRLFNVEAFYHIHKKSLFTKMADILIDINKKDKTITRQRFYKYCDVLDYILSDNRELSYPNLIKKMSRNKTDEAKIRKHFVLALPSQL